MRIFFSVGEPSGDLHGANLIRALARRDRHLECVGLGGPKMAAAGCELLRDMSDLALMGLLPVLLRLPELLSLLAAVDRHLAHHRPEAVVLIDYPGFNWWVAWRAKARGIPVVYYGLPQLWAWGAWRVEKVKSYVDHPLCKLPFEEKWFRDRGCPATYVGHPYFDELADQELDAEFLAAERRLPGRLVTILPGSRNQEVADNLTCFLRAAERIRAAVPDARFAVAAYNEKQAQLAKRMIYDAGHAVGSGRGQPGDAAERRIEFAVHVERTPELIHLAEVCLACSGSVSLELLWHAKPSVIHYYLNWWLYRGLEWLVDVRYCTLVNLLTAPSIERRGGGPYDPASPADAHVLLPEYPTFEDKSLEVAGHVIGWLTDEPARRQLVARLESLRDSLAKTGASETAADYILRHVAPATRPIRPPAPALRMAS